MAIRPAADSHVAGADTTGELSEFIRADVAGAKGDASRLQAR